MQPLSELNGQAYEPEIWHIGQEKGCLGLQQNVMDQRSLGRKTSSYGHFNGISLHGAYP